MEMMRSIFPGRIVALSLALVCALLLLASGCGPI
jgi:hypothetical protein